MRLLHKDLKASLAYNRIYVGVALLQTEAMLGPNKLSFVHTSRKLLFEDFRAWLSKVSGIDLDPTIDMSCAKYEFTGKESKTLLSKDIAALTSP